MYSRAERYFASKSFAVVREAFSNAYPDKVVWNKTTVHRLVTKFRDTGSVCDRKYVRRRTVLTGVKLFCKFHAMEAVGSRGGTDPTLS
jgi:hypothetical protein